MRTLLVLAATALALLGTILWRLESPVEATLDPATDSGQGLILMGLPGVAATASPDAANPPASGALPTASGALPTASAATALVTTGMVPTAVVPELAGVTPLPPLATSHRVQEGESMYGIVRRYWGNPTPALVESLAEANRLFDPGALEVGQTLKLPASLNGVPQSRP